MMDTTGNMTMYETCLLHARADRELRAVVTRELASFDITMMEWLLLGVVCGGPSKGLSMTAISQELDVTLPQVTALMANLNKHRLVRQKTQKQDRRSRHVLPTAKGKDLLATIEKAVNAGMQTWLAEVPKEELDTYMKVVRYLASHEKPERKLVQ